VRQLVQAQLERGLSRKRAARLLEAELQDRIGAPARDFLEHRFDEQPGGLGDPRVAYEWQFYRRQARETTVLFGLFERPEELLDVERRQRLDLRRAARSK
jgi:hypothetical protein